MDRLTTIGFPACKLIHALKDEIKREDELMFHLWNDGEVRELLSDSMEVYCSTKESKSITKAQVLKNIGNKQFQAKNYSESIQSYTQCAMYAPEHSPECSVAIANRSASLFFLNRYKDCIKDIELAIELNCPKKLHYKLHLRKVQCYLKLGNPDLATKMISKIRESIDDPNYIEPSMKDDIEKRISGITFNGACTPDESKNIDDPSDLRSILMFDENPNFPHASSSIDRKFNEERGRHVVANRFIRKGEVLFIEKPISFAFVNEDAVGRTCHHCCRSTDIPVPCLKCLNIFYCDTNCSNEAWSSYHRWECPGNQMGLWEGDKWTGQFALKLLLVCTTTTDTTKFNEMQNLITNFDKMPIEELITHGFIAMLLTRYLLEHTDFLQRIDLNDHFAKNCVENSFNSNFHAITDDNKHLYVSSLLLRYILQHIINSSAIRDISLFRSLNPWSVGPGSKTVILGRGIYPSASMMNHSCDPNIVTTFMHQYQIIRALRDIAGNEEILTSYGPDYRYISREERQEILSSVYYFTCKCEPCTQPNLKYFLERFTAMNCSKCNGALCNIENSLFCLDCYDKPKHFQQDKIKQAEKLFKQAKNCIARENVKGALKKLEECLNIRRRTLYKSNQDIVSTLHVMSELYMAKGKLAHVKKCGESLIAVAIERYGPSSAEHTNELWELVIVCLMYLEKTSDTTTSSYKALFATVYEYLEQVEELMDLNYGSWSDAYRLYKHVKDVVNALRNRFNGNIVQNSTSLLTPINIIY